MQLFASPDGKPATFNKSNEALNVTVGGASYKWYTNQTGGKDAPSRVEVFAASWVRDLMIARSYADSRFLSDIAPQGSRMTATTDANFGYSPTGHFTHDVGMAMDLSVLHYIDSEYQKVNDSVDLSAEIANADGVYAGAGPDPIKKWNNERALDLVEVLKGLDSGENKNRQYAALKDFLALYAVTQDNSGSLSGTKAAIVNANDKGVAAKALFEGISKKGYIGQVGKNKNEYKAINEILDRLNVDFRPKKPHADHFHLSFQAPQIKEIEASKKLNTFSDPALELADAGYIRVLGSPAQPPTQYAAVIDICKRMQEGEGSLLPAVTLSHYLRGLGEKMPPRVSDSGVKVLREPKFGGLELLPKTASSNFSMFDYHAFDPLWIGKDRVDFEVSWQGRKYKIISRIEMVDDVELNDTGTPDKYYDGPCDSVPRLALPAGGETSSTDDLRQLIGAHYPGMDLSRITLVFAELPGAAVGDTVGEGQYATITIDADAASHGWFTDLTPGENEEFLPTSDPNIFHAKPGSAAEGRMDMLSVLLHEYGHALGLDHSPDPASAMAAVLSPGVRHLLSMQDLAVLHGLYLPEAGEGETVRKPPSYLPPQAGEGDTRYAGMTGGGSGGGNPNPVPTPPLLAGLAGLLWRQRRSGEAVLNNQSTAINPTLQNGHFADASSWATTGTVSFSGLNPTPATGNSSGQATLTESTAGQTSLRQLFTLRELR